MTRTAPLTEGSYKESSKKILSRGLGSYHTNTETTKNPDSHRDWINNRVHSSFPTLVSVFAVAVLMARVDPRNFYLVEEQSYKILKESEGDEAYLQRLIGGNLVSLSTLHFRRSDPPLFLDSSPIYEAAKEYPRGFPQLQYGRQFLIRRQFELWAAVYKYRNSQEFVSPEAGVAIGRVVSKSCRVSLRKAYSSDLYIQKEVERLRRIYGKDHSEVIAGLTGAEIIAYMDEHLPEPDPRALIKSGSGLTSPSNLTKRGNSEGAGAGTISGGDKSAGEESDWSGWLWFVCAVAFGGLAAAWYLRRRG